MYCHPTHISMKICPFYLEGKCKYSEEDCQLSHGHLIHIDELREYEQPDVTYVCLWWLVYYLQSYILVYCALLLCLLNG